MDGHTEFGSFCARLQGHQWDYSAQPRSLSSNIYTEIQDCLKNNNNNRNQEKKETSGTCGANWYSMGNKKNQKIACWSLHRLPFSGVISLFHPLPGILLRVHQCDLSQNVAVSRETAISIFPPIPHLIFFLRPDALPRWEAAALAAAPGCDLQWHAANFLSQLPSSRNSCINQRPLQLYANKTSPSNTVWR